MLVSRVLGDYHVNGWPMSQCGPPKKPHCWTTMRVEYLKCLTCNWSGNHVTLYLHYTCLQAYLVNAWFTNPLSNKQVQRAEKLLNLSDSRNVQCQCKHDTMLFFHTLGTLWSFHIASMSLFFWKMKRYFGENY